MEEKLYFKPGNYGKGRKKKQTEQKVDNAPEKKDHKALKFIFLLLFLLIAVTIIIWLLKGKTTTTGQYPENLKNESLSCVSTTVDYEKANYMTSNKHELKINAVFYGQKKLSSISLIYMLEFGSDEEAYSAEAVNSTKFELALQQIGRSPASFHKKFTRMDNKLVVTLQADANEIDDLTKEYFLIDKNQNLDAIQEYRANYESKGFTCKSSIDN